MEQNKAERLNENVTEKMCSSDGNVVGEMCSPADADTCGICGKIVPQKRQLRVMRMYILFYIAQVKECVDWIWARIIINLRKRV
jgi:hypothetical protein